MRSKRVTLICTECEKRYRRVLKPLTFEFCPLHGEVSLKTRSEFEAIKKTWTWQQRVNRMIREYIHEEVEKMNAKIAKRLTEYIRARLRERVKIDSPVQNDPGH